MRNRPYGAVGEPIEVAFVRTTTNRGLAGEVGSWRSRLPQPILVLPSSRRLDHLPPQLTLLEG